MLQIRSTGRQEEDARRRVGERGFSLAEVLVAMFLIALALLGVAPLFVLAMQANAAVGEMGTAAALAVERMEQLRAEEFSALKSGGSLSHDDPGFSVGSNPDFSIRWTIDDETVPPDSKTLVVEVVARRAISGAAKRARLTLVRAR